MLSRRFFLLAGAVALAGCSSGSSSSSTVEVDFPLYPNETPELRRRINHYADLYAVPRALVHRVVIRESTHNPGARNGPYYGLMQILPATARGIGYEGPAEGLMDADTNLKYGVKYLRGAYIVADGDHDGAVKWYSRGYYFEAKRLDLLVEAGLRN